MGNNNGCLRLLIATIVGILGTGFIVYAIFQIQSVFIGG